MTREEAIKLLEHISIAYTPTDAYGDYDDPQPYEDALNMAIEALSAEAVDVAHDIPEYCRWSQTYTNMVQSAMSNASAEAVHKPDYSYEADMVKRLRQAEAVQGWIPCEEEMPIDSEEVIASVYWTEDGDSIIAYGHYSARFDKWRLYSDMEGELIKGYEVTAWMPLPKPYKGGDDTTGESL